MIVLDASAAVEALLDSTPGLLERLLVEEGDLHAPHLIDIEVVSVLRRLLKAGLVTASRADRVLDDFQAAPLTRYPHTPFLSRAWALRDNLSPYDALYVALAETLDAPLLTKDRRLAGAPGHKARIEAV